jgi:GNAT superfamily N-acetyltransferase
MMSDPNRRHVLRPTQSADDWTAYHSIRRDSIFGLYLAGQVYDEKHPDEFKPGNLPHVLVHGDEVVGTVRIDLLDHLRAGFRLIGIRTDLQRQGHGTTLLVLAERLVHGFGKREITINATARSLPFYLKHGYVKGEWKDIGPVPEQLIRVGKRLA